MNTPFLTFTDHPIPASDVAISHFFKVYYFNFQSFITLISELISNLPFKISNPNNMNVKEFENQN